MKNKRLIGIIAALAVLVAGSLIYSSMNKPEAKNEKKVAKVGVLQFVSHPSLDLIYKGDSRWTCKKKVIKMIKLKSIL